MLLAALMEWVSEYISGARYVGTNFCFLLLFWSSYWPLSLLRSSWRMKRHPSLQLILCWLWTAVLSSKCLNGLGRYIWHKTAGNILNLYGDFFVVILCLVCRHCLQYITWLIWLKFGPPIWYLTLIQYRCLFPIVSLGWFRQNLIK